MLILDGLAEMRYKTMERLEKPEPTRVRRITYLIVYHGDKKSQAKLKAR